MRIARRRREESMKLPRRAFLHLTAGAVALPAASRLAWAQAYPSRPVRLIVQVPAGGAPDIIARVMGEWLSERLGQQFVIDNRPGASGNVATEAVIRSPADGYTLLLAMSANAINPSLYENLRFHFARDAAPVASIGTIPLALEINPSLPVKTIPEFIAYAKANPGKINVASTGNGTPLHVAAEMFKMMAGVNLVHVAYRGEPTAIADLIAGQVQAIFGVLPSTLPYIRSGQVRALGITTAKRQEVLPDLPAIAEFLPGFEASGWYGVAAPKDTPPEIVDRLNKEVNAGLADPKTRKRLTDLGCLIVEGSPADFSKFINAEIDKWTKVVRTAGLKMQ
jgi:tripartite-type tricarboxylate transporter receptor subunit TctC